MKVGIVTMKNNIFKKFSQKDIIQKMNLVNGYVNDSKRYFNEFENYLYSNELSNEDKLICINNLYREFISNHSMLLKDK